MSAKPNNVTKTVMIHPRSNVTEPRCADHFILNRIDDIVQLELGIMNIREVINQARSDGLSMGDPITIEVQVLDSFRMTFSAFERLHQAVNELHRGLHGPDEGDDDA